MIEKIMELRTRALLSAAHAEEIPRLSRFSLELGILFFNPRLLNLCLVPSDLFCSLRV